MLSEELKKEIEKSVVDGGSVIFGIEFIDLLLRIIGCAVASIENGNIYEAKEILGETGELIYQRFKSILVE